MKIIRKISIAILAVVLVLLSVCTAFAETYYEVNGYTYTIINNSNISLVNWDTSISDELVVPDGLAGRYFANIGSWAFERRTDLKSLDLSQAKHLSVIGYEAFIGSGLENDLIIPESVTGLNERSFAECSSLPAVTVNGGVKVIPKECFCYCDSLKTVILSEGLTNIQQWAFGQCPQLEYAEIPKSVTYIADTAFKNDSNLVLGVYKDTYALQYAEENEIDHIILDGDKIGDVNGDGVVDILDATEIQKYAAESTDFTPEQFELGDINKDGYCDVIDALLVQKSVIGAYEIPPIVIRY